MSYCRWSSNNFWCDVYVYEDVAGGWTTHVAGNRLRFRAIPEIPMSLFPRLNGEWDKKNRKMVYPSRYEAIKASIIAHIFLWSHRLHMWSVSHIPRRNIGLEHDGETFNDPTPGECASRLIYLRDCGYIVPKYAIDSLLEEQREQDTEE